MKLAIFKRIGMSWSYEAAFGEDTEDSEDYARVSEYVDVDFPPLPKNDAIAKQLAAIDRSETELRNKFQSALNGIERQRAELMALPNLETANDD